MSVHHIQFTTPRKRQVNSHDAVKYTHIRINFTPLLQLPLDLHYLLQAQFGDIWTLVKENSEPMGGEGIETDALTFFAK